MNIEQHGLCTVRLGYMQHLLQCLEHMGLDPARIYDPMLLAELSSLPPQARRPVEDWDSMIALAEQHTGGIDIALKMAELIKPWDTGLIGFLTMACPTLENAFEAVGQFFHLFNDVYTLHGQTDSTHFQIGMKPLGAIQSARLERLTLAIIAWHARWLAKRSDLIFDVAFSSPRPAAEQVLVYQRTFGGRLTFDCPETRFSGPAEYAGYPVSANSSQTVHHVLRAQLMAEMDLLRESSSSVIHKIERLIKPRLEAGDIGIDEIAAELGISRRTLQNRLDESGLAFRDLLDRMRHAQALVYIGDASISLIHMAQMLGFATQSTFHRAFKRWTGVTPGEYRRQKLGLAQT
jgi:AraC-like DNA-binding protein